MDEGHQQEPERDTHGEDEQDGSAGGDLQVGETAITDVANRAQQLRDGSFQQIKDALAESGAPWLPGQTAGDAK